MLYSGFFFTPEQTKWQMAQKLDHPCYTELPALDDITNQVLETGIIVITGKAGEGKTTLGLSVLRHFQKVSHMAPINLLNSKPSELHKILMTEEKCVILLDDIFGKTGFEIKRFERWQPMFEELYSYKGFGNQDMRSVFIVITLRKSIYLESLRYLRSAKFSEHMLFTDSYVVDIDKSHKMDRFFKLEMLSNYSSCYKKFLSRDLKSHIATTDTPLGFPYLCKIFFKTDNFFQTGLNFFEHPFEIMVAHIKEMHDLHFDRFVTLCVVLLFSKDSCFPSQCLYNKNEDLCELLKKFGDNAPDCEKLKKTLKFLQGTFLSFDATCSTYRFSHMSTRETVFFVAAEKFLDVVLRSCKNSDLDLVLCDFMYGKDSSAKATRILLRKEEHLILYERIYDEILHNPYETANLKIMQDVRFVNNFLRYCKNRASLKNLLAKRYTHLDASRLISRYSVDLGNHSPSFLLFCYRNPILLSQIIECYDPSTAWFRREKGFTLELAMGSDCPQVVEIIILFASIQDLPDHPFTQSLVVGSHPKTTHSASQIDLSSFELVQFLAERQQFSMTKHNRHTDAVNQELFDFSEKYRAFQQWTLEKKETALKEACIQDNLEAFKFLLQKGNLALTESHVCILKDAHDDCNKIVEYIISVKLFNKKQKSVALETACCNGYYQRAKLLIADATPIDDGMLQTVAGLTTSEPEFIELIYNSREWSSCLSEFALQTAFMKGNVEVVSFFINNGTRVTDNCLIFAALSAKAIPLYSILAMVDGCEWSSEAVNKAIEIACAKNDFSLLECILNIKRTNQTLAIVSTLPESHQSEEIFQKLLEGYRWTRDEKRMALWVACDRLNIPIFKKLVTLGT